MKQTILIAVFAIATMTLTACNGDSKELNKDATSVDSAKAFSDTVVAADGGIIDSPAIAPATVACRLFFKGFDFTDEETGEMQKGEVSERKQFATEKSYTFCYDSESFDRLELTGTGKGLSLIIKAGKEQVFKKESFDLSDKVKFTQKDFVFEMGSSYTVVVEQKGVVLFEGKIDSQGCM